MTYGNYIPTVYDETTSNILKCSLLLCSLIVSRRGSCLLSTRKCCQHHVHLKLVSSKIMIVFMNLLAPLKIFVQAKNNL